jgi:hypothetical protein
MWNCVEGTPLAAIMPRIEVDKQFGINVAIKSRWITGTSFGSEGIGERFSVEIRCKKSEPRLADPGRLFQEDVWRCLLRVSQITVSGCGRDYPQSRSNSHGVRLHEQRRCG